MNATLATVRPVADGTKSSRPIGAAPLLVLGAVVFISHIDIARLGLDDGTVGELRRIVTICLAAPGALLLAFDPRARGAVVGLPMLCLTAALGWTVIVSPWGENPVTDLVEAVGLASLAALGSWAAVRVGWNRFLDTVGAGLGVFLAASIAAPMFDDGAMLDGRLRGLAFHPNELGVACVIAVVAALSGILRRRRSAPIVLALAVIALLASDSRTSLVAAVIVTSVWARPLVGRAVPLIVTAAGLVATAVVLATGASTRVSEAAARTGNVEEISTVAGRVEVWEVGLDLTNAQPLAGHGANSSTAAFDGLVSWGADHAHNLFLQMGVHGGWPALLLTVGAFVVYWARTRHDPAADRDAIVVGLLVVGLTEAVFRRPGPALIAMAGALSVVATQRSMPDRVHSGE